MTNEELCQLIQEGQNVKENLATLYSQNRGLLYKVASRFSWAADIEDLMQECFFSVQSVARAYRPEMGKFSTLFVKTAARRLHRYCQRYGNTAFRPSPYVQLQIYKLRIFETQYTEANNRPPEDEIILDALGITAKQLHDLRRWINESTLIYLDAKISADGETLRLDLTPSSEHMEAEVIDAHSITEAAAALDEALHTLPDLQRQILHLMFNENLSAADAGKLLGLNQRKAWQEYGKALGNLRRHCREQCEAAAEALGILF